MVELTTKELFIFTVIPFEKDYRVCTLIQGKTSKTFQGLSRTLLSKFKDVSSYEFTSNQGNVCVAHKHMHMQKEL